MPTLSVMNICIIPILGLQYNQVWYVEVFMTCTGMMPGQLPHLADVLT